LVELKKSKDSNAALLRRTQLTLHDRYRENGMPTEKRWAAFTLSMQNTVKALDSVISAASDAKDAEEQAFRSHYRFHVSNKKLRESRQLWNQRIRQYKASRVNILKIIPNDEVPNSKSSLRSNRP
jgi:recombinational DNA repair protein (RecF pathway)